jgi:hypothetical protein
MVRSEHLDAGRGIPFLRGDFGDSHQNEDRQIGRGTSQRKIPTLRDALRRVGINERNVKDSVAKTNWLEEVEQTTTVAGAGALVAITIRSRCGKCRTIH